MVTAKMIGLVGIVWAIAMAMPSTLVDWLTAITLTAAVVAIAARLIRWARHVMALVERIHDLATSELERNHGGSIKDDVNGLAIALGKVSRDVDELAEHLYRHHPKGL